MTISTKRLKQLVSYDPITGIFRWKYTWGRAIEGNSVGSAHSQGYIQANIDRHRVFLHRIAWQYVHGVVPKGQIDHINGDRLDNRIVNLRLATQQQNSANMRRRPNNKSGLKGVVRFKNRWRCYVHVNGKTRYLGTFKSKNEAHSAYVSAAVHHFGKFARAA